MKRTGRLKPRTPKRSRLDREAAEWRRNHRNSYGRCMICGHSPENPRKFMPPSCSEICCHEIGNGDVRKLCLTKPFAILVLCWHCNQYEVTHKNIWPEARQLALLKIRSPEHYDREAFVSLIHPNAPRCITDEDVEQYIDELREELSA